MNRRCQILDLIEHAEAALDDLIDVMGRATIEAVLLMSAEALAGPKQQGKKTDRPIAYHGSQAGRVALKERQLRVTKPRLRKKSPQPGEAGERLLRELAERDLSGLELLAVWIDGLQLGAHHVICLAGVDAQGTEHVLGLSEGATENAAVATTLLQDLVRRGLDPTRPRLFVIDGSRALRCAIDAVFGAEQLVQRCRNHKVRNVESHPPKDQRDQARATLRAAFKLNAAEGMVKLQQYASWLDWEWPGAAASLREGLEELFTVSRLGLTGALRR